MKPTNHYQRAVVILSNRVNANSTLLIIDEPDRTMSNRKPE